MPKEDPNDPDDQITFVFDLDGTLKPETPDGATNALQYYTSVSSMRYLSDDWRKYPDDNVITWFYEGRAHKNLLLPGALEMFQYLVLHYQGIVRLVFFSAGRVERNEPLVAAMMQKVADNLGLEFAQLQYTVFSKDHLKHGKKQLSAVLPSIKNAILIDDRFTVVKAEEAAYLLKAVGCTRFSGVCLAPAEMTHSDEERIYNNLLFLDAASFYENNQIFYILGLLLAILKIVLESRKSAHKEDWQSVPRVLHSLQICPETRWYKYAASSHTPIGYQFTLDYYLQGFLALQSIQPSLQIFMPFSETKLAVESIQQKISFIADFIKVDTALKQAIKPGKIFGGRKNHQVIDCIHDYHDSFSMYDTELRLGFFGGGIPRVGSHRDSLNVEQTCSFGKEGYQ